MKPKPQIKPKATTIPGALSPKALASALRQIKVSPFYAGWPEDAPLAVCWYCGATDNTRLSVDHARPLARGGANRPSNLVLACMDCNRHKADLAWREYRVSLGRALGVGQRAPLLFFREMTRSLEVDKALFLIPATPAATTPTAAARLGAAWFYPRPKPAQAPETLPANKLPAFVTLGDLGLDAVEAVAAAEAARRLLQQITALTLAEKSFLKKRSNWGYVMGPRMRELVKAFPAPVQTKALTELHAKARLVEVAKGSAFYPNKRQKREGKIGLQGEEARLFPELETCWFCGITAPELRAKLLAKSQAEAEKNLKSKVKAKPKAPGPAFRPVFHQIAAPSTKHWPNPASEKTGRKARKKPVYPRDYVIGCAECGLAHGAKKPKVFEAWFCKEHPDRKPSPGAQPRYAGALALARLQEQHNQTRARKLLALKEKETEKQASATETIAATSGSSPEQCLKNKRGLQRITGNLIAPAACVVGVLAAAMALANWPQLLGMFLNALSRLLGR